jgi:hypothetical protein
LSIRIFLVNISELSYSNRWNKRWDSRIYVWELSIQISFFLFVDSSTRVVENRWVLERLLSKIEFDTSRTRRFFFSRYWIIDLINCTKLDAFMIKRDYLILSFIIEHRVLTISFFTFVEFNSLSKNSWIDENNTSSLLVFIRTESHLKKNDHRRATYVMNKQINDTS